MVHTYLYTVIFNSFGKEAHRRDLPLSIELLSAYTKAKSISSEEVNSMSNAI